LEVGAGVAHLSATFGNFLQVLPTFLQVSALFSQVLTRFLHVLSLFLHVFGSGFGPKTALALEKRGKGKNGRRKKTLFS